MLKLIKRVLLLFIVLLSSTFLLTGCNICELYDETCTIYIPSGEQLLNIAPLIFLSTPTLGGGEETNLGILILNDERTITSGKGHEHYKSKWDTWINNYPDNNYLVRVKEISHDVATYIYSYSSDWKSSNLLGKSDERNTSEHRITFSKESLTSDFPNIVILIINQDSDTEAKFNLSIYNY